MKTKRIAAFLLALAVVLVSLPYVRNQTYAEEIQDQQSGGSVVEEEETGNTGDQSLLLLLKRTPMEKEKADGIEDNIVVKEAAIHYEFLDTAGGDLKTVLEKDAVTDADGKLSIDISALQGNDYTLRIRASKEDEGGFWVYSTMPKIDLSVYRKSEQTIVLDYEFWTDFTVTGGTFPYDSAGKTVSVKFDTLKRCDYTLKYSTDGVNWQDDNPVCAPGRSATVYVKTVYKNYPSVTKQADISVEKPVKWVIASDESGVEPEHDQTVLNIRKSYLLGYNKNNPQFNANKDNPIGPIMQQVVNDGAKVTYSSDGSVAAVDENDGTLSLLSKGTETITVNISETADYAGLTFTYLLIVQEVGFDDRYTLVPFMQGNVTTELQLPFQIPDGEKAEYYIKDGPADGLIIDDNGVATVKKSGRYTINAFYAGVMDTFELLAIKFRYIAGNTDRKTLLMDNEAEPIRLYYGLETMDLVLPESKDYLSNVKFEIVDGEDIVSSVSDITKEDSKDITARVSFKSKGVGSFKIITTVTDGDHQAKFTSWFDMQPKEYASGLNYAGVDSADPTEKWKTDGITVSASDKAKYQIAYDDAFDTEFNESITYVPGTEHPETVYVKWKDNIQTYISSEIKLDTTAPSVVDDIKMIWWDTSVHAVEGLSGAYLLTRSPDGFSKNNNDLWVAICPTDNEGSGVAYVKLAFTTLLTQETAYAACGYFTNGIFLGTISVPFDSTIEIEVYDRAGNSLSLKSTENVSVNDDSKPFIDPGKDIFLDGAIDKDKSSDEQAVYPAGTKLVISATDPESGIVKLEYQLDDVKEKGWCDVSDLKPDGNTPGRVTAAIDVTGKSFTKVYVRAINYFGEEVEDSRTFERTIYIGTPEDVRNLSLDFLEYKEYYQGIMTLELKGENLGEITHISSEPKVDFYTSAQIDFEANRISSLRIYVRDNIKDSLTFYVTGHEETAEVKLDKPFTLETSAGKGTVFIENETKPQNEIDGITYFRDKAKLVICGKTPFSGIAELNYSFDNANILKVEADDIHYEGDTYSAVIELPENMEFKVSVSMTTNSGHNVFMTSGTYITDSIDPEIQVEFDNNADSVPNFFSAGRKATIKVLEKNFHSDSLIIRSRSDEKNIIATFEGQKFREETDEEGNTWKVIDYPFEDEKNYDFIVVYTDYSGNITEYDTVTGFVIDKTIPGVKVLVNGTNDTYFKGKVEIVIEVTDKNFDPELVKYKLLSAKDAKGNAVTVTPKDADGNKLDPSLKDIVWTETSVDEKFGPVNTCRFYYDVDAQYVFDIDVKDKAGNAKSHHHEFFIDTKAPAGAELILPKEVRKDTLDGEDYRFYDGQIEVGIKSSDVTSGIASIRYECIDQADNTVFQSQEFIPETAYTATGIARNENVLSNETLSVTFKIEKDFRGFVKIYVKDRTGNEYVKQEKLVVVVDTVKPVIKVEFDNNDVKNGKHYSADRTAFISLTEANYFAEDNGATQRILNIKVSKTDSTTGKKTEDYLTAPLSAVAEHPGLYRCSYSFSDDAAYILSIDYADRSGNQATVYLSPEFVVDKTAPKIHVSYDNNSAKNKDQFQAIRKATIVIEENNFDPAKVFVTVTSGGAALAEYQAYLNERSSWTHENNAFTATIVFEKEGHYTFGISCRDLAENGNDGVDFGACAAPDKFTIDTTAPDDLTMMVGDTSVRGSMEMVAFERFYQSAITVKLAANCDISGLESLQYQKVDNAMAYSPKNTWTDYNDATGIVIAPSEKCIIYFKAEDRAGNVSIIRSVGMVIDDKEPTGEVEAPEIDIIPEAANARGYHNSDVNVALKVLDPGFIGNTASGQGYFSGLKSITYRIYTSDLDAIDTGVLLDSEGQKVDGAVFNADGLISSWSGTIRVDAERFNRNDVVVEINAEDNSGNIRTSRNKEDIRIDITKPVASVSYDNNVAYYDHYFNQDRVATIVVTERNFDPALFNLSLTNTAGEVPALSAWEQVKGTGNGDDTKWIAKLVFTKDGDYTFEFSLADEADNACSNISFGDSVCPNAFTMDQTRPVISIDFDNKDAQHENYYKAGRQATITVVEHNFDPNLITVAQSAVLDEEEKAVPELSEWTSKGDTHTATLRYTDDAYYVLTVGALDKANNAAEADISQTFYVDKEAPQIRITGIEAGGAYNGDVQPTIEYDDVNFDPQNVQIVIERSLGTDVPFVANTEEIRHGMKNSYENVPAVEENDDIYTIKVTVTDMAGNQSASDMKFSVNRFGSTYSIEDSVSELLGTYVSKPAEIVLKEVNPDELSDIRVTIFKNNETIVLNEDTDYTVSVGDAKGMWKEYTFRINESVFQDDGVYRVSVHSVDKAGNVSENTMETKNTAISFGVDKTMPRIVVTNVENGKTYPLDNLPVEMTVSDNLQLASVKVYLDGEENLLKEWNADEIRNMENGRSDYNFDISGESKQAHRLLVVAVDSAGNVQREEISGFYVTKDLFTRFVNNKPLLYGSIAMAVVLLTGGIGLGVFLKKRKKGF